MDLDLHGRQLVPLARQALVLARYALLRSLGLHTLTDQLRGQRARIRELERAVIAVAGADHPAVVGLRVRCLICEEALDDPPPSH